jgi:hypothetical protein
VTDALVVGLVVAAVCIAAVVFTVARVRSMMRRRGGRG